MEITFINGSYKIYHSIEDINKLTELMIELQGCLINPTKSSGFFDLDAPMYQNDFITKLSIEECRSIVRNQRWENIDNNEVILIVLNERSIVK